MHPAVLPSVLIGSHFLADWVFQSRYIAENKSKKLLALIDHVVVVGLVLLAALVCTVEINDTMIFSWLLYVFLHGVQDWFIWRGYAKFFHKECVDKTNNKAFWNTIAVDQFIHLSLLMVLFVR